VFTPASPSWRTICSAHFSSSRFSSLPSIPFSTSSMFAMRRWWNGRPLVSHLTAKRTPNANTNRLRRIRHLPQRPIMQARIPCSMATTGIHLDVTDAVGQSDARARKQYGPRCGVAGFALWVSCDPRRLQQPHNKGPGVITDVAWQVDVEHCCLDSWRGMSIMLAQLEWSKVLIDCRRSVVRVAAASPMWVPALMLEGDSLCQPT
jgi:hypothetical protein